jgi:hypothetical protein
MRLMSTLVSLFTAIKASVQTFSTLIANKSVTSQNTLTPHFMRFPLWFLLGDPKEVIIKINFSSSHKTTVYPYI